MTDESEVTVSEEPVRREPVFNMPGILVAVIGIMILIQVVRSFVLTEAQDNEVLMLMAFLPTRYLFPLAGQDFGWLIGPVGYSLLHGDFVHLGFNCLWLAVFATPLVRRIGTVRFVLLWITSAVFAAFFQAFVTDFEQVVLIGASGVVSATVGAACRFSMQLSGSRMMAYAHAAPRLGIFEALTRPPVLIFMAMWALSNALVLYGVGVPERGLNIAWQAHLGGFLFGYLTFALFDRNPKR